MRRTKLRSIPLALASLLLAACASTRTDWRELQVQPQPFEEVWNGMREAASSNGFFEERARTDRGLKVFESRWKTFELPFGKSKRSRLHAEIQPSKAPAAGWTVRFYVEQQTVHDMARSMSPEEDDWSHNGQDADMEATLMRQMELRLAATHDALHQ